MNFKSITFSAVYTLLSLLSLTHARSARSFFDEEWTARHWNRPATATPKALPSKAATTSFNVNTTDTVDIIRQTIYGNNASAWTRNVPDRPGVTMWQDERALRHLRNAQIQTLRIPGGAWSNTWLWDRDTTHWKLKPAIRNQASFESQFATWTMSLNEMLRLCDSIGTKPQIIVNAALAQFIDEPDPIAKAAHYAAQWVRYVNGTLKKGVRYWEVDNEDYGKWMINYEVDGDPFTGKEYGEVFNVFVDSMKAADPTIKIGAVLYPEFKKYPGNIRANWTQDVLAASGATMDFMVIHEYFTYANPYDSVTFKEVLDGRSIIASHKRDMDSIALALTGRSIPLALTEYNMRAGSKNTEMVSALFIAEALGEFTSAGYGLVNLWQVNNGSGVDDHGMLARKDWEKTAAVTKEQVDEYMPHPGFFSYYYYRKYFGDIALKVSGGNESLHLYASRFSDSTAGLVLVNESGSAVTTTISLQGWEGAGMVYWHTIHADSIGSRILFINDSGPIAGKVYGPPNYETIPPYSAPLDSISAEFIFDAPPYSANFIAVAPPASTALEKGNNSHRSAEVAPVQTAVVSQKNGSKTTFSVLVTREVTQLTLQLFDLHGRVIAQRVLQNALVGHHTLTCTTSRSGLYLLMCRADNYHEVFTLSNW